jgi:hypothetical protein
LAFYHEVLLNFFAVNIRVLLTELYHNGLEKPYQNEDANKEESQKEEDLNTLLSLVNVVMTLVLPLDVGWLWGLVDLKWHTQEPKSLICIVIEFGLATDASVGFKVLDYSVVVLLGSQHYESFYRPFDVILYRPSPVCS